MFNSRAVAWSFFCTFFVLHSITQAADLYAVGQKVEVREGDSWSPASVLAHEGRKYQVHYDGADGSTDEWVTTDRIRRPGAPAAVGAAQPTGAAHGPSNAGFEVGDNIEAKWGGLWRKASVVKKTGSWTLVEYDNVWYEWVQPWRLRRIGSGTDTTLDSTPSPFVEKSAPAPAESPTAGTSDPDAFHISETIGAGDLPIVEIGPARHEITASIVKGSPSPDAKPTSVDPKVLPLHQHEASAGAKLDLLTTPQGKFAEVMTVPSDWHQAVSIQRIDLAAGTAGSVITLPSRLIPLAINADGTRLVTRSDKFFPATKWRLDLWAVGDAAMKPLLSFRPYPLDANGNDRVLWASWLDASHLLTCSGDHTLSLWEISDTTVKEIYTLHGDSTAIPRLSAGGKYVTAGYGRTMVVVEAMTGTCVARCSSSTDFNQMASGINPEITRLALCGGSRLIICDLQSGKPISDVGLPVGVSGSDVDWIAPKLLLIDKRWIYDTEHQAIAWEFTAQEQQPTACWMGDRLWTLLNDADPALVSVNLLNPSVLGRG
jgi:hypothetical protein